MAEIGSFTRLARGLVPPLQVAFPWLSVTPKLHALAHHAPTFLRRFGSLGAYGEQALEAWHGFFNYSQARCTADSFLGACKRLVEQAALQRQPGAISELANGQRRTPSQKAGARLATQQNDGRLRRNEDAKRGTVAGDSRVDEEMCQWAKKRACKAKRLLDAFNARNEVEYGSDDEYSDSELVGGDEGIDRVAALVMAFYDCKYAVSPALSLPLSLLIWDARRSVRDGAAPPGESSVARSGQLRMNVRDLPLSSRERSCPRGWDRPCEGP